MNPKENIKYLLKKTPLYNILRLKRDQIVNYFEKRRRVSGHNQYTVVSAVYNVDKYLEEYFESIVNQTLKFEDHIHLIMVDDGSPDSSAKIIKKWQEKYPNNITYLKKENGGQASARNLGIEHVKTEWVTFIDSDDFLHYQYFENVDQFLEKNNAMKVEFISCNIVYFHEKDNKIKNNHPLRYKYSNEDKIVTPEKMEGFIQLSASISFFKKTILKQKNIVFPEHIKPNFEDAYFVNQYFIENPYLNIGILKKPIYFYRKRSDTTSTIDNSWKSIDKYTNVLEYGYLNILKFSYNKLGKVPLYIQRTVLSDLIWHLRYLINHSYKVNHLSFEHKSNYLELIKEIFCYIDKDTIENFDLINITYMHKVGILGRFKNSYPTIQQCNIDFYDEEKQEIEIHFFYYLPIEEDFFIDSHVVKPRIFKTQQYDFVHEIFVYEKIIKLPLSNTGKELKIKFNDKDVHIILKGRIYNNGLSLQEVKNVKF